MVLNIRRGSIALVLLVGLRLLPLHRRSLRPGVHRSHLLRGGRPVRARHAGGHFLEARNTRRRHQRARGRLRRLGLHPGPALPGGSRADEPGGGHPGAVRSDRPEAFPLVRTGRARSHRARRVLDPAGQCRLVRGRVPLQPAECPRAHPGDALRRCVHLPGQAGRLLHLARYGLRDGPAVAAGALSREPSGPPKQ